MPNGLPNKIVLEIPGYVPPSKNSLRGSHWSVLYQEKRRAATSLRNALASNIRSLQYGLQTTTTLGLNALQTALLRLDGYAATIGGYCTAAALAKRHTTKRKKKPSLK